jgi:hypothetical protein
MKFLGGERLPSTDELLSSLLEEFKGFSKAQEGKARDLFSDKISLREVLAAKQKRDAVEKLSGFYDSDVAKKTVKELLTSTSSIALPTMVQARALLELANWSDLREISMVAPVPNGAGKTVDTNIITQPAFGEWTEGSALTAADPTLTKRTVTLKPFGKVTQISDLLANTSAINFVEQMGMVHGACVRQGIFSYVGTKLSATAGGTISAASGSVLTFTDVTNAIKVIANNGFQPDFIVTSPSNMWTAFSTSHAVTQFYGALNDLFKGGIGPKPRVLGLEWYADPYWDTLFPAYLKRLAYVGCKGMSSIWAAIQTDPLVEIYRVPTELSNYIITHMDGGAAGGIANSIEGILYAS